jgi:hypothetical protein
MIATVHLELYSAVRLYVSMGANPKSSPPTQGKLLIVYRDFTPDARDGDGHE